MYLVTCETSGKVYLHEWKCRELQQGANHWLHSKTRSLDSTLTEKM